MRLTSNRDAEASVAASSPSRITDRDETTLSSSPLRQGIAYTVSGNLTFVFQLNIREFVSVKIFGAESTNRSAYNVVIIRPIYCQFLTSVSVVWAKGNVNGTIQPNSSWMRPLCPLKYKICKSNNKILRILQNKHLYFPVVELYKNFNALPPLKLHEQQIFMLLHKFFISLW